MKRILLVEIPLSICVSYTLISMFNNTFVWLTHGEPSSVFNNYMMLLWCGIGTTTIYGQKLLTRWSPLLVLLFQYIFANGMIVLSIYVTSFFMPIHPDGYRDGIRSFSFFFVIGAVIYYIFLYLETRSQNSLLQQVKSKHTVDEI